MPLKRDSDTADPDNLVGVTFAMIDDRGKRVICRVTYEALCDRAAMDGNGNDWLGAWASHRVDIEALASANYDAHKPLSGEGLLLVDTLELTPL